VKVVFLAGLSKSYPVYLDGNMNKYTYIYILAGGFGTCFFHILGRIIPTDELIFFGGVAQPPTRRGLTTKMWPNPLVKGSLIPNLLPLIRMANEL
jgi:hypothetical protein